MQFSNHWFSGRVDLKKKSKLEILTLFVYLDNFLPHMFSCKTSHFCREKKNPRPKPKNLRRRFGVLQVFSLVGMLVYNKWMQHWRYPFILMAPWSWWVVWWVIGSWWEARLVGLGGWKNLKKKNDLISYDLCMLCGVFFLFFFSM